MDSETEAWRQKYEKSRSRAKHDGQDPAPDSTNPNSSGDGREHGDEDYLCLEVWIEQPADDDRD